MTGEFQHRNLPILLLQARESVMGMFRPILKEFSMTEQQWRIIRTLNERPDNTLEAGRIAKLCCILSPSLTGVLERMERDGLVRRSRDTLDQRKVMISMTDQSRELVKQISPLIDAQYVALESKLGADTVQAAYQLLDTMIAALPV